MLNKIRQILSKYLAWRENNCIKLNRAMHYQGGWVSWAIPAGASILGSVLGSNEQANAAQSAADTSAGATKYAADIQKQIYDQTRADQTPWREAGANSLAQLVSGTGANGEYLRPFSMADYTADPGYKFRLAEGQKALDRSAAARGGLQSGAALKAAARYGQDYGSNEYQNAYNRYQSNQSNKFNRLASLAGVGQTANNALQQAGQNYATGVGGLTMANADTAGNAALAAGNARASMYGGIGNTLGRINWGGGGSSGGSVSNWGYDPSTRDWLSSNYGV